MMLHLIRGLKSTQMRTTDLDIGNCELKQIPPSKLFMLAVLSPIMANRREEGCLENDKHEEEGSCLFLKVLGKN